MTQIGANLVENESARRPGGGQREYRRGGGEFRESNKQQVGEMYCDVITSNHKVTHNGDVRASPNLGQIGPK